MKNPNFSPATRVGDIVAAQPQLARVFERIGIDFPRTRILAREPAAVV